MKTTPDLHVVPREPGALNPPPDRGRLLTADQVAADLFNGTVSPAWVRRNCPGKIVLGHSTVRWFERDVRVWLEGRRTSTPGVGVVS